MITGDKTYVLYMNRVREREFTLCKATMDFVGYFMGLGDDMCIFILKLKEIN